MSISGKRKKEIEAIRDADIDTSDIPETDAAFWDRGDMVLLHGSGKKTRRTPRPGINIALKDRKGNEGDDR